MLQRLTLEDLQRLDDRLAWCARSGNAWLLCVGVALWRLRESGRFNRLGYSSFEAYVRQRVQRSAKWAADLALLAKRLSRLPRLRAVVRSGAVPMSAAHIAARKANPETDADWAVLARQMTVRELKRLIAMCFGKDQIDEIEEEDGEPRRAWTRQCSAIDQMLFEAARMRLERVNGRKISDDEMAMAIDGETLHVLLGHAPEGAGFDDDRLARALLAREENAEAREESEARVEPALPRRQPTELLPEPEVPDDIVVLDRFILGLCKQLAALDLEIGRLGQILIEQNGWRRLGYGSQRQYARERAGMDLSAFEQRRRVARKAGAMPALGDAVVGRQIGFSVAGQLATIAKPETIDAWLDRVGRRTVKHVEEEVAAARILDLRSPPTNDELESVFALQRAAEGFVRPDPSPRMFADAPAPAPAAELVPPPPPPVPSLADYSGRVRLYPEESWHDTLYKREQEYRAVGSPFGTFIRFAALCILDGQRLEDVDYAYKDVHFRDRNTCTCPVCSNRFPTPHHVRFRSQGGTEDRWNLTSPDGICHLDLIHMGYIVVTGRAPDDLTWILGPPGCQMIVKGRVLVHNPNWT